MKFRCSRCAGEHDVDGLSFGANEPAQWTLLREDERIRSFLGEDQCVIDADEGKSRYLRGCLEIPIRGRDRTFTWGVWVSLSEASDGEIEEHWDDPERVALGPRFGWLCTALPGYPDTMCLKTRVHQRPPGQRPFIDVEPTERPLAVHQREGIPASELRAMVARLLHPE